MSGPGDSQGRLRSGRGSSSLPVSILLLVLLPLLLMPLAAVFVFALKGGPRAFWDAIRSPEAQFALRFSLLIAFGTTAVNAVLGTFTAYVLAKHRFPGHRALGVVVNLPVAIPTVVVGTSLLLLWGPIGLFGKMLVPIGLQPMFRPVRSAPRPPLRDLPVHARRGQAGLRRARDDLRGSGVHDRREPVDDLPAGAPAGAAGRADHGRAPDLRAFPGRVRGDGDGLRQPPPKTQTAPLYIFAQFEAGDIAHANALAAVLALLSFTIFFFLFRFATRESPEKAR